MVAPLAAFQCGIPPQSVLNILKTLKAGAGCAAVSAPCSALAAWRGGLRLWGGHLWRGMVLSLPSRAFSLYNLGLREAILIERNAMYFYDLFFGK